MLFASSLSLEQFQELRGKYDRDSPQIARRMPTFVLT